MSAIRHLEYPLPRATTLTRDAEVGAWSRGFPRRLALLNDYVRIPYANGSSFASQMLYREFVRRGHEVTVVGPADGETHAHGLPRRNICFRSLPLANHPGVYLPLPTRQSLSRVEAAGFDLVLAQTGSALADLGVWLRQRRGVPFVCVNTIHLPSVYNVVLPDRLFRNRFFKSAFENGVVPWLERRAAAAYNQGDGLVVLSKGLERYWRERGVTVPISVIPRSVEPSIFDAEAKRDPFRPRFQKGYRLLVVCRHTREKSVDRLLEIFATLIAPACPEATLTLVGDGPDHQAFRETAERLGVLDRTDFVGEKPLVDVPAWYRHADLFVYTSLSETYGQVVGEAMWCGLPTIAFADDKGVSDQILDGENGFLVQPGPDEIEGNWRFANAVLGLLREPNRRHACARRAREWTRAARAPERAIDGFCSAFDQARRHAAQTVKPGSRLAELRTLSGWTALHLLAAAVGKMRTPADIDLADRRLPPWDVPARGESR